RRQRLLVEALAPLFGPLALPALDDLGEPFVERGEVVGGGRLRDGGAPRHPRLLALRGLGPVGVQLLAVDADLAQCAVHGRARLADPLAPGSAAPCHPERALERVDGPLAAP